MHLTFEKPKSNICRSRGQKQDQYMETYIKVKNIFSSRAFIRFTVLEKFVKKENKSIIDDIHQAKLIVFVCLIS